MCWTVRHKREGRIVAHGQHKGLPCKGVGVRVHEANGAEADLGPCGTDLARVLRHSGDERVFAWRRYGHKTQLLAEGSV